MRRRKIVKKALYEGTETVWNDDAVGIKVTLATYKRGRYSKKYSYMARVIGFDENISGVIDASKEKAIKSAVMRWKREMSKKYQQSRQLSSSQIIKDLIIQEIIT